MREFRGSGPSPVQHGLQAIRGPQVPRSGFLPMLRLHGDGLLLTGNRDLFHQFLNVFIILCVAHLRNIAENPSILKRRA